MVGRGEITDNAWEQIALLLPDNGRRGGQWSEHRKVVNGILWRLRTGPPWRASPSTVVPGRPATTTSCAGGGMALGIGCLPTSRPRRTRWARSSGR